MLILSRCVGEKIVIGHGTASEVTVVVHKVRGRKVGLGIIADPATPVQREELLTPPKESGDVRN